MSKTDVYLYRAVRGEQFPDGTIINEKPALGILYPDFESRKLPNGKERRADVDLSKDKKWVKTGGGTSLFDRSRVFKSKGWLYFDIPDETVIPDSLKIRFTNYNPVFEANHYQIECSETWMLVDAFKGALDNLARNAVVRYIELANKK